MKRPYFELYVFFMNVANFIRWIADYIADIIEKPAFFFLALDLKRSRTRRLE